MIETDEILYSRFLAERSEDAFRILLERHRESLMLFLLSYVHNMEDAEELMLDAYAEAAAGAGFSGKSSFTKAISLRFSEICDCTAAPYLVCISPR